MEIQRYSHALRSVAVTTNPKLVAPEVRSTVEPPSSSSADPLSSVHRPERIFIPSWQLPSHWTANDWSSAHSARGYRAIHPRRRPDEDAHVILATRQAHASILDQDADLRTGQLRRRDLDLV